MSIKETLERFDEIYSYPTTERPFEVVGRELKQFITEEIKLAIEEVRNIELATNIKTVAEIGKLNNKAETFGYAQAWMCKKLDKNISKYFEV